ncbi:restriction endonuclease subunit S [Thiothrix subterranea]|uniref:restriction endonuclease subunit S n=1 Tax=Thiothrix subterranea TaxID=2735563 RepID=UPI00192C819B|nr:restriction endonuclease subunit S [Thiothrix subterranea]QQZ29065.1 restriction endonuclease subunit S [Thiothrix subterranea]
MENIEGWSGQFIETESEFQGDGIAFQKGDILFGKLRPYLAKVYLADFQGEAVGDFHVMRPTSDMVGKFALYQCLNKDFITTVDSSTYGAKMPRVSWEYMANMLFAFPSFDEQQQIAAFLDRETVKIDQLIAKQQQLIELLKEKRQAVISHAVTKGLNPDVKMNPSGVEWLGDVPEHWTIAQLKLFTTLMQTGPFGSQLHAEDYTEEGVPVINPAHITPDRTLSPDPLVSVTQNTASRLERHQLNTGDLILGRRGELGRCAVIHQEQAGWICGTGSLKITVKLSLNPEYTAYLISSEGVRAELSLASKGSTMDNLNTEILGSIRIPIPPVHEQQTILENISNQKEKYHRLLEKAQRQIGLLRERRAALISAAVTGKIDVREVALLA